MKKTYFVLISIAVLISCRENRKISEQQTESGKEPGKLELLLTFPVDTVIDFYDLSNDSIREFPDLSGYTIKSLDLSHNEIDTFIVDFLPAGIEKLNLSYNLLREVITPEIKPYNNLKEIDVSHNQISFVYIAEPIRKINASHNELTSISFSHKNIEYVDVSYNPNLSNVVGFDPYKIDTVIHNNIANNRKLIYIGSIGPEHVDYIIISDSVN
ncbi:hypothetical protein [Proteiniphilum sp. X52]|uniref:hypothetical protein n=1 Tax=Proteiniphilum sp. X52 TaxID=2382159 RepID=UPI000F09DD59|nr:hypothetical protein [Proteiniphilum sp. X52]RNC63394.1 hypothetical protein D7D25_16810 [Proteiniphilum sp. X52]